MRSYPFSSPHSQVEAVDFISQDKVYITEEGTLNLSGYLYEAVLPSHAGTGEMHPIETGLGVTRQGDRLFLEPVSGEDEFDEIQLFNLRGNLLLHETHTGSLSLAGIPPGCFIIRCMQDGRLFCMKWIYGE
jgi:hypothetical protein